MRACACVRRGGGCLFSVAPNQRECFLLFAVLSLLLPAHCAQDLHRIENVNVALANLKNFVPDIDVDARAIVARNTKLILGFVWQLILRFQILAGETWESGGAAGAMRKAREKGAFLVSLDRFCGRSFLTPTVFFCVLLVLKWWREQLNEYAKVVKIADRFVQKEI